MVSVVNLKPKTMTSSVLDSDWSNNKVVFSVIRGLALLALSLVVNFQAGTYASLQAGKGVKDIILDNIKVRDVDSIFIYGIIAFFIFISFLLIVKPKRIPFVVKSLSVFILIRSFFVILTHIGPSQDVIAISPDSIINYFNFTGDLFFSGHTGLPFLFALIFWNNYWLRWAFVCCSIMFAIVVLLGHLHYSIDVFAAYFITYGIFHISTNLFNKEFHLLNSLK